jgi:hypothetical protein
MNEPAHGVAAYNSQQPEHEQDYENRPKHLVTSASVLAFLSDWRVTKEMRLSEIESCAKVAQLWPEKKACKLFRAQSEHGSTLVARMFLKSRAKRGIHIVAHELKAEMR